MWTFDKNGAMATEGFDFRATVRSPVDISTMIIKVCDYGKANGLSPFSIIGITYIE